MAATHGEPLENLLALSARSLLESSGAGRAGVWIAADLAAASWMGRVAQYEAAPPADFWQRLDPCLLFPGQIAAAAGALCFHAPNFPQGLAGFFDGMEAAVWLPLQLDGECLGGALAAAARSRDLSAKEVLESHVAEIAVAVSLGRARQQWGRAQRLLDLRKDFDRALASGAPAAELLGLIAAAAAEDTGAEFLGLARPIREGIQFEAFAGSEPAATAAHDAVCSAVAQVVHDGHSLIRSLPDAEPCSPPPGLSASLEIAGVPPAHLNSPLALAALPIEPRGEDPLVLVAGYVNEEAISLADLHGYATMTASARMAADSHATAAALHSLLQASSEALLIVSGSGEVREASRRARDILPRSLNLAAHPKLTALFSRPSAPEIERWLAKATAEKSLAPLEAALPTGFGVRLAPRSRAGDDSFLVVIEEAAVVERAERQGRQSAAELRGVLETIQTGVLLVDLQGRIRHTNAPFGLLFGLDARTLEALETHGDLEALVATRFADARAFAAPWKGFAAGSDEAVRDELNLAGQPARVFERYGRPVLDAEGRRAGWLEIYTDITSRRQIQSKLLQTEKMAALGQLVSGIAHELNNPLTSIMGYAQLLLGRVAPEALRGEARLIFGEAERARRIVKNLLFFARQTEPERSRVDVNEIVQRAVALRGYELKVENITASTDLASGLPPTLADPYQLQQVILNLIINAEQAILEGRGQGRIEIRTRKISASRLAIEVLDDGPGVPPELASRIFDPFFSTKAPGAGTGLGLSIVYGIVEHHDGEVAFENLRTGGAKFTIELPIVAVPAGAARATYGSAAFANSAAVKSISASAASAIPPSRILVVEDEPTVAQLVADVLSEEGHQVDAVLDSQEGLTRAARNQYDLILCDLRMPRLDGPAFYDALASAGSPVSRRILFITGDTLGPHTIEFLKSRQLPFLAKPFLVEELMLAVNRLLEGHAPEAPAPLARSQTS